MKTRGNGRFFLENLLCVSKLNAGFFSYFCIREEFLFLDGYVVKANGDYLHLHKTFGESWKVPRRKWLFRQEETIASINSDIEKGLPFDPNYDNIIENEQLRLLANQATFLKL